MADRYWVGGTNNWDGIAGTKWSTSSGGAGGASVPTSVDDVFFTNLSTGVVTIAAGNTGAKSINCTGFAGTVTGTANITVSGSVTLSAGMTLTHTGTLTINATGTITSAGKTLGALIINGVGITVTLGDALICSSTATLTAGTINLNNNNFTCLGFISSSETFARAITSGTGQFFVTGGDGQTLWDVAGTTNYTVTGTPIVNKTFAGAGADQSFILNDGPESVAIDVNVTAGTNRVLFSTLGGNASFRNINFTGYTGNANFGQTRLYRNLTLNPGMSTSASTSIFFQGSSGIQQITTNGVSVQASTIFNGTATYQLQDNYTIGLNQGANLTSGTLDLNTRTFSCGSLSSSGTSTRSILFNTGSITATGNNTTVWNFANATNFTYTGTPTVNLTYAGATGTRTISHGSTAGATEANSVNINITAGTDVIQLTLGSSINNLNYTGFTGTSSLSYTAYGNLTLGTGMTVSGSNAGVTFASTSGTKTITTNGVLVNRPLAFDGVGGTWQFQDALTQEASRSFIMTNGTVQLRSGVTSTVGFFYTTGSGAKTLAASTPGSRATISQASGTVRAGAITIQDSNATGGATFYAWPTGNGGNNLGWIFSFPLIELSGCTITGGVTIGF